MIFRTALVVLLLALLSPAAHAQSPSGIQGVWKTVEVQVVGGPNPRTITPQPGIYIFTRGFYSILTITSDTARTAIPQSQGRGNAQTDAQKLALYEHWSPFTANSGTYTITGNNTLATKALVAKNEGAMQSPGQSREFKLEGSTLWLIQRPPAGQSGAETRTKLTRLE